MTLEVTMKSIKSNNDLTIELLNKMSIQDATELLNKLPVKDLRKLFTGSDVKFYRDDKVVSISNTRKDELVNKSLELLVHDDTPDESNVDSEHDLSQLISFEKLVVYTNNELVKIAKTFLFDTLSISTKILKLSNHTFHNLRGMTTDDGTRLLSDKYRLIKRSKFLKSLKIETDNSNLKTSWEVIYEQYKTLLLNSFDLVGNSYKAQHAEYKVNLHTRQHDMNQINALPVIKWATETLQTELVDEPTRDQFYSVALALIVVTGRRTAEILDTGRFEYVDKYSVQFTGQLKTKGRQGVCYIIPTLVNSNLVIKSHSWLLFNETKVKELRRLGKVESNTVNRFYSKGLSRKCFDINPLIVSCVDGTKPHDETGNDKSITPHRLREIYAQTCYKVHCPEGSTKDHIYISTVLGHAAESYGKPSDTAQSYNSYYSVMDYQEIKQFLGLV